MCAGRPEWMDIGDRVRASITGAFEILREKKWKKNDGVLC